jgi:hypothetical protein
MKIRNHEAEEWLGIWGTKYQRLEEISEDEEPDVWDLYDFTKEARVLIDELDHNLNIYVYMTLAMIQDMHPTLTSDQKNDIHKMYFTSAAQALEKGKT